MRLTIPEWSRVLLRAQQIELGLPVPEHVGRHAGRRLRLADPVVELVDYVTELIRCLRPLLGLKVRTFRAVISMLSPV